jgi:hypothetical protein
LVHCKALGVGLGFVFYIKIMAWQYGGMQILKTGYGADGM